MISTAIILAGGLGTRLRSEVPDLPKCMAPVNGNPFLKYVVDELLKQGVTHFIFSIGYKREPIIEYLHEAFPQLQVQFAVEQEPLGTGGGIRAAGALATEKNVFVLNGDTLFKVNLRQLSDLHYLKKADCTLSLKPMQQFDRYGVVELNNEQRVLQFKEKQFYETGLINGGVYALNVPSFLQEDFKPVFSFEKEYLERLYTQRNFFGFISNAYFIDIGIPADYQRAQTELA